jgi:hypothetical protein
VRRLVSAIVLLVALGCPPLLHAQQVQVGGSYALLSLTYPDQIPSGFGGWLTWGQTPALEFDLGVNLFPEDHPIIGRQTQFLAGLRSGFRTDRFAAFGRVRPGVTHFSRRFFAPEIVCIAIFPTPEACLAEKTNFTLDLGGTFEVFPASRMLLRFDVGDALIRFSRTEQDPVWKHNFQFSAGAGVRF